MLLILDDSLIRLASFELVVAAVDRWTLKTWVDAPSMIREIDQYLEQAVLISLDHDLYKQTNEDSDPGTGRDVAEYLSDKKPTCSVIVHSTNTDAAWGMYNTLQAVKWNVELVHHLDQENWIRDLWLPVALRLSQGGTLNNGAEQMR